MLRHDFLVLHHEKKKKSKTSEWFVVIPVVLIISVIYSNPANKNLKSWSQVHDSNDPV